MFNSKKSHRRGCVSFVAFINKIMNGSTYNYTNNGPIWFIPHDCFASHAILNELSCPLRTVINALNNTVLHSSDAISLCSDPNIFRSVPIRTFFVYATVIIMFICSANIYYATLFFDWIFTVVIFLIYICL